MIDRTLLNHGFPDSTWGNLGLWTHAQHYPAACEALAVRLAEQVHLGPGHSVMDVGFGYGDQLLVWKNRFGVGRISGIETDADGIAEARCKLAAFTDVSLRLGDGFTWSPSERYDRVLALDCAYHFAPRSAFFSQAYGALKPGGLLGLTDIVLAQGEAPSQHGRLAKACGIPPDNLMTQKIYGQSLTKLGFTHVSFQNLDEQVLTGFSRFAFSFLMRRGTRALSAGGLSILATASAAAWLRRGQRVHYVLVSAKRPKANSRAL